VESVADRDPDALVEGGWWTGVIEELKLI